MENVCEHDFITKVLRIYFLGKNDFK